MTNTNSTAHLVGGYVMIPRAIEESSVSKMSPCAREAFNLFLRHANHKDVFVGGTHFRRGELLTSYKQIIESLSWHVGFRKERYTKDKCEAAMKALVKGGMIATRRTTRGVIVTVCNYDYWQTPSNYEGRNETGTKTTRKPQRAATINKNEKNEKKEKVVHNLAWIKNNKQEVIDKLQADFPDKNAEYAYNHFIERCEIKDYGYKNYLKALADWLRRDEFNQFAGNKKVVSMFDEEQYKKDKALGYYDYN